MGKGEFDGVYYTGNYDINDTTTEKVSHLLKYTELTNCSQIPLLEFDFNLPIINIYNSDVGIGIKLLIDENIDDGKFTMSFSFPDEWYPNILGYNR